MQCQLDEVWINVLVDKHKRFPHHCASDPRDHQWVAVCFKMVYFSAFVSLVSLQVPGKMVRGALCLSHVQQANSWTSRAASQHRDSTR